MASQDRYQLVRKLGEGGMGIVHLYHDTWLRREIAIKTVKRPEGEETQEWRAGVKQLIREAQAAAGLRHPHIATIYDVIPDGISPSIIMEYVPGKTLAQASGLGAPAETSFALRVLKECASALDYAHSRRRIHRDLKPGNVMLDDAGSAFIVDFGIAKMLDSQSGWTHGTVMGTFEYMSPEQMEGGLPLDGRSDQYSLAVVAYQLATGCRVFDARTLGTLCSMVLFQTAPRATERNPGLPIALDAVFSKALAKKAAERYPTCTEFVAEIEGLMPATSGPRQPSQDALVTVAMPRVTKTRRKADHIRMNEIDGQRYRWIPPGTFQMGCSPGDEECYDDEKPAHEVIISRGFWMGETPVTVGAYRRYAADREQSMSPVEDEGLPVVSVTWEEAADYCKWAGARLPTEAEWEYAARAGTTAVRYGALDEIAWGRCNGPGPWPVGQKQPNAFGLFDMLGTVWEWTADWYDADYYKTAEKLDPQGPPTGMMRTLRGDYPRSARVSGRNRLGPGNRYDVVGFRCVMDWLPYS